MSRKHTLRAAFPEVLRLRRYSTERFKGQIKTLVSRRAEFEMSFKATD